MGTKYVVGFYFDSVEFPIKRVALIKKTHPEWQKGLLNGIGGAIEFGETPIDAMIREFEEETDLHCGDWELFCKYIGDDTCVYFFKTFGLSVNKTHTTTDEEVGIYDISELNMETKNNGVLNQTVHNLKWLIPLALDKRNIKCVMDETYIEIF